MNNNKEVIETFHYEGVLEILEEKYGKKFMIENADLFYLWYCVKRKHIRENREDMIKYLKDKNIIDDTRRILSTVSRYYRFREVLPEMSGMAQHRLNRGNQYLSPIIPFEKVGNRMLGIIDDMNKESYSVVDISEGRENKVAVIFKKGGVSWRNDNLHPSEMRWVVDKVKKQRKGVFSI
ncbi:hypothetical protein N8873_00505 [Flavobacteriaceae bacterium]|nr:hypothetical protein [Flavobacteriaceae bacterium]